MCTCVWDVRGEEMHCCGGRGDVRGHVCQEVKLIIIFGVIVHVFVSFPMDVGMEEADPPATPIGQPFKVGDLVHVFEGACKGLALKVVVSGFAFGFCFVQGCLSLLSCPHSFYVLHMQ